MQVPKWLMSAALVAIGIVAGWVSAQYPRAQQSSGAQASGAGRSPDTGLSPVGPEQSRYPLTATEKGGMAESGPYEVVPDHFKPKFPDGWTWGPVRGMAVESPDRIYISQGGILPALKRHAGQAASSMQFAFDRHSPYTERTGLPARDATDPNGGARREFVMLVFEGKGNQIAHWKHLDAIGGAHRVRINPYDPEHHVWYQQPRKIYKLKRDTGEIVMTIEPATVDKGAYADGRSSNYEDVAFLPSGDFYALEHSRVVKFSKDGKQLMAFGKEGLGPGEIFRAHALAVDSRGRIYVGSRPRIQVFDPTGKLLDIWPNIRFGSGELVIDKRDHVWIADAEIHRIAGFDLNGRLLYTWGVTGSEPGQIYGVSQINVDSQGNLYLAEHYGGRPQMLRPKKGADPNHLIAQTVSK